jgi:hypothetical protein
MQGVPRKTPHRVASAGRRAEPKGSNPRSQAIPGVTWALALEQWQQSKMVESAIIHDQRTGPGGDWAKAS